MFLWQNYFAYSQPRKTSQYVLPKAIHQATTSMYWVKYPFEPHPSLTLQPLPASGLRVDFGF